MSYTSLNFMLFVGLTAAVYFVLPVKKYQWTVLVAASFVFYYLMVGGRFMVYILLTIAATYGAGLWMEAISQKAKATLAENKTQWDRQQKKEFKSRTKQRKRLVLILTLTLNFGILGFLKYYNFFAESLNGALGVFRIPVSVPALKLLIPLGISFYTFQSMGYVVDVYREKVTAERNPLKIALFVSFFPQIVQGPISFYDQLARQLYEPHSFDFTRFKHGCELILWGFFKKLVIADRAVIPINAVLEDYLAYNGTTLTFAVVLYALQLYADFSGGIDISRGVAQILGIDLAENFRCPYFAETINDYWRRWHISLGAWMRSYVFYPLAVSKPFLNASKAIRESRFGSTKAGSHVAKVLPTSFASLVVFLLVGIWHGANWKYVAFGLWNGGIIMLSTLLQPVWDGAKTRLHVQSAVFRLFRMVRTFLIVLVGYVFDVAPGLGEAMHTFRLFFTNQNLTEGLAQIRGLGLDALDYGLLAVCTGILFTASVIQEKNSPETIRSMLDRGPFVWRYLVLLAGIMMVLIFGIYGPGYDAAKFVYMQF